MRFPVVVLVASLLGLPASAALQFGPEQTVPPFAGSTPGPLWGDFDADGRLELMVSGLASGSHPRTEWTALTVLPGGEPFFEALPGLRTWTAYRTNHFPAGTNAVAIGVIDDAPETFFRGRLEPP